MKILHTIPAMDGGGADRILYDYAIRMIDDDLKIDFLVHTENEGILEGSLKEKGCNIYHIPALRKDKLKYILSIRKILKDGHYDVIHVSQGYRGLIFLFFAKIYGVKVRIAHSHMAFIPLSLKGELLRKSSTFIGKLLATHLFACGRDAAVWMWGEDLYQLGKVHIMTNAIDTQSFAFSIKKRNDIRNELGLTDKFVIGNVARFSYQKNHEFLVDIFAEIKKIRNDAVLMLIGRGELEEDVKKQVECLGLSKSVIFMGVRNDVSELLNAMDVFLLPSRFEGLPVTLVEVQANGLTTFASDVITDEIKVANNVFYLSLSKTNQEWATAICESNTQRLEGALQESVYDINRVSCQLKDFYYLSVHGK